MIVTCRCPGRLRKRLFKAVVGRGVTAAEATTDLKLKISVTEDGFQTALDRWTGSVRCSDKGCIKVALSGTKTVDGTTPADLGNGFVTVAPVSGYASVTCQREKSAMKKD